MVASQTSRDGGRRLPAALLRLVAVGLGLLFAFALGEVGVRLLVDFEQQRPRRVAGIDPERPTRFLAGTSQRYQTQEFDYTVRFNRFGRRDVEWDASTIGDPRNILFIGDSFVLGNGLQQAETIPAQLEDLLAESGRPLEVFNFGLPGGGPPEYLRLFEEAIEAGFAASTVVVMVFVGNDFYPSVIDHPAFDPVRRREMLRQRQAAPSPVFSSHLLQFVRLRLTQSAVAVDWALRLGDWLGTSFYSSPTSYIFQRRMSLEEQETFDTILGSLVAMKRVADDAGRELLVVITPNRVQVENAEALTNATLDAASPNRRIVELCVSLEVACLDLLPLLKREAGRIDGGLYYPIDRHLNPEGAKLASLAIAEFLSERKP